MWYLVIILVLMIICRYNVDYDTVNVVIFRFVIDIEL